MTSMSSASQKKASAAAKRTQAGQAVQNQVTATVLVGVFTALCLIFAATAFYYYG